MKELLKAHQRKALILMMLAAPLILLATNGGLGVGQTKPTSPGQVARAGLGAGAYGSWRVTASITGWLKAKLRSADDEAIEQLKQENARLREEKSRLIGVLQENMRLRELVGFKERQPEYELVPARVIARDTTPYFRVLKIRLEVEAPIAPRMPVVVAGGVVGQIHEVHATGADVILVSDPRSRLDVISQRNRAQGVVQGLGHDRDYSAKIAYLDQKDSVRVGDIMVTSGLGHSFPRELIVGRVIQVQPDDRGLFQQATLEPAVDFGRVDTVFVITGKKTLEALDPAPSASPASGTSAGSSAGSGSSPSPAPGPPPTGGAGSP